MIVRSAHVGFSVPDCEAALGTLYYPGSEAAVGDARLTGAVAPETGHAPWPLAIILPGINVPPDSYRWLAHRMVELGMCAATYAAIGSLGPAGTGLTPGMDMTALAPDVIGSRPSATAVLPLIDRLRELELVRDHIDFDHVVIGGHSAGGTVALHNSDPSWIPGLAAVFAYGAHTMTSTSLGHEEASVAKIPSRVPVLLLSGSNDEVIAASRDRYRSDGHAHDPVGRTFSEGISRDNRDSWSVVLRDGNHFTMCDPIDESSGRSFLEPDLRADDEDTRDLLVEVIEAFLDSPVDGATRLEEVVTHPGVATWDRR